MFYTPIPSRTPKKGKESKIFKMVAEDKFLPGSLNRRKSG